MSLISAKKICNSDLRIIPFDCEEMNWDIYLIKKKAALISPGVKAFEKLLLKHRDISRSYES